MDESPPTPQSPENRARILCEKDFYNWGDKPCGQPAVKFSRGIEGFDCNGEPYGDRLWPVCQEHAWEDSDDVSLDDGEVEYAVFCVHSK